MKKNLQFTIYNLPRIFLLLLILHSTFYILHSDTFAVSLTPTPTQKTIITPLASPSASLTPTTAETEKVQEIRRAIQDKLTQIKEKIEKRAYVGTVLEITDSTFTINNFRGKQRVRLSADTTIIGANKKEITAKDIAVDDKIIAMGTVDENETLNAKRIIVVPAPATMPAKRVVFPGSLSAVDNKASALTVTSLQNPDQSLNIKIDKNSKIVNPDSPKEVIKFQNLNSGKKLIVIYLQTADKTLPTAKTIFVLP
ncbi:MAG: hypothetical protein ACPLY7_01685 [Microgenomates group bacterium]